MGKFAIGSILTSSYCHLYYICEPVEPRNNHILCDKNVRELSQCEKALDGVTKRESNRGFSVSSLMSHLRWKPQFPESTAVGKWWKRGDTQRSSPGTILRGQLDKLWLYNFDLRTVLYLPQSSKLWFAWCTTLRIMVLWYYVSSILLFHKEITSSHLPFGPFPLFH